MLICYRDAFLQKNVQRKFSKLLTNRQVRIVCVAKCAVYRGVGRMQRCRISGMQSRRDNRFLPYSGRPGCLLSGDIEREQINLAIISENAIKIAGMVRP